MDRRVVKINEARNVIDVSNNTSLKCRIAMSKPNWLALCCADCAIFRVDELDEGHSWRAEAPNGEKYAVSCGNNLIGLLENE